MKLKFSSRLPQTVIDTTLLSRLIQLEIIEYLPDVFGKIRIPPEVKREAFRSKGRKRLKSVIAENAGFFIDCHEVDYFLKNFLTDEKSLDKGEAAALAQADYTRSSILIDEGKGRKVAVGLNLTVIPTGRVLLLLKEAESIKLVKPYLDKLRNKLG